MLTMLICVCACECVCVHVSVCVCVYARECECDSVFSQCNLSYLPTPPSLPVCPHRLLVHEQDLHTRATLLDHLCDVLLHSLDHVHLCLPNPTACQWCAVNRTPVQIARLP